MVAKSPVHNAYDSENEDDSSSSSIITGGAQTPPSANNRLGVNNNDSHSIKSHTPLSIKSEQSSNVANTRSPSLGSMAPSSNNSNNNNNNSNINLCGTSTLASMPSTSPYSMNSNLAPPHPSGLPTSHYPFYQHHHAHHHPGTEWYSAAAVAAPPPDMNHLNHFNTHHHLMHHATAY